MDNSIIITIFIACVSIIPGIAAIIYEYRADKDEEKMMMRFYDMAHYFGRDMAYISPKKLKCEYCKSDILNESKYCEKCGAPSKQ